MLLTVIGVCYTYKAIHSDMLLVVVGGSFQMDESPQGNVTIRFTLMAENPTFRSITYHNISGTLAVLNSDPFLRFPMTAFHVKRRNILMFPVESPTQVRSQLLLARFPRFLLAVHHC